MHPQTLPSSGAGIWQQLKIPRKVLLLISVLVIAAWIKLLASDISSQGVVNRKQKGDEPYESFIYQLTDAVTKIIPQEQDAEILIKQLAYKNVNNACKTLLAYIRRLESISDYLNACVYFTPSFAQGIAIAAALQCKTTPQFFRAGPTSRPGNRRAYFSCGQK